MRRQINILIGGGGTGGHVFPALAIAQEIRNRQPGSRILFVGAEGRMEMTRVPEAGFDIVGLPIAGLQRRLDASNLMLPWKVGKSLFMAIEMIRKFKPDVAVGVGGYASAPLLLASKILRVPYLIQEQNSFAGLTNKLLARSAKAICVAFSGMEKYFPKKRLHLTGNPVRKDLIVNERTQLDGQMHFGLQPGVPTILVLGGSLGARTINESVLAALPAWQQAGYQLIWQTGTAFAPKAQEAIRALGAPQMVSSTFIKEMDYAYAAADLVVSRAGALSLAELCISGKASVLVPSPNVAEDHQTHNAMALVEAGAAQWVKDKQCREQLPALVADLMAQPLLLEKMAMAAHQMATPKATETIVNQIFEIARK